VLPSVPVFDAHGLWRYRDIGFSRYSNLAETLIGLGTAPLEDPMFRTAVFEQLGEQKLEAAVTTDICGKKESHATRLDAEAVDTIRKVRLHRKIATVVFFESNGGQAKEGEATVPEIRLAVAEPELDVGNVETAIEALAESCYSCAWSGTSTASGWRPTLISYWRTGGPISSRRKSKSVSAPTS